MKNKIVKNLRNKVMISIFNKKYNRISKSLKCKKKKIKLLKKYLNRFSCWKKLTKIISSNLINHSLIIKEK